MPKLSDANNESPLSADFGMYYRGTYVAKETADDLQVMYVERVEGHGDESKLHNVLLSGNVRSKDGELGNQVWRASEILAYHPFSGYYRLSAGIRYVSFLSENRTQKKGLTSSRLLVNGQRAECGLSMAYRLYNDTPFEGRFGRDLCVIKGELHWKGSSIGRLADGDVTINQKYEYCKELVCKLLARSLVIKSVTIQ